MKNRSSSHKIAIISFSPIAMDSRVLRQIKFLSQEYQVNIIGYGKLPLMDNCKMFSLEDEVTAKPTSLLHYCKERFLTNRFLRYILLISGRVIQAPMYELWYWTRKDVNQAFERLIQIKPQVIHANDWITLPLAIRAAKLVNAKVVSDLHEYAPLEKESFIWRMFLKPLREYFLHQYMRFASASVTVNKTIANRYKQEFDFEPIIVMNTPALDTSIKYKPTRPDLIQIIHHGTIGYDRKPELMMQTIALCDKRYHLNLMLIGNEKFINDLEDKASKIAPERITFHQPVPAKEVVNKISQFDIGLFLLPPTNYNNWVTSPNKLFEFIHAGLAICVGPSPEMKRICEHYGCGFSVATFNPVDCANALNDLTISRIDNMKQASLLARQELNADKELTKLLDLYKNLAKES